MKSVAVYVLFLDILSFIHPITGRIMQSTVDEYNPLCFAFSVQDFGSVPINIYEAGKEFEFIVPLDRDTMVLLIYSNYCPTLYLVVSRTCH